MSEVVIVGILSLIGTLVGSIAGILTSNKLVVYRIEQLERKVEKHNNVVERVFALEKDKELVEEEFKNVNQRIDKLEKTHD